MKTIRKIVWFLLPPLALLLWGDFVEFVKNMMLGTLIYFCTDIPIATIMHGDTLLSEGIAMFTALTASGIHAWPIISRGQNDPAFEATEA
jgi:hypothetical protein